MVRLRRKSYGQRITLADYNGIVDALNWMMNLSVNGPGCVFSKTPHGPSVSFKSADSGTVTRAQTREAGHTDDVISVNLLDSTGNEIDNAVDVYVLPSKAAINMNTYLPIITDDMKILVSKDQTGDYYLVWPTLVPKGSKTSTVIGGSPGDATVLDITGAVLSSIGEWA